MAKKNDLFTLEALKAKHGDSLILHYGKADDPRVIVIDGGPAGVYTASLRPRLEQIKQALSPNDPLPLEMVMVSHIDDDHINGVLALTGDLIKLRSQNKPLPFEIITLWHNSFDEVVGNDDKDLFSKLDPKVKAAAVASNGAAPVVVDGNRVEQHVAAVVASVGQGRKLRANAQALGLRINDPFKGLVTAPPKGVRRFDFGDGLKLTVLGPNEARVRDLHEKWEKELKKSGPLKAIAAAYADESVFNLSSIIVLAEVGDKRMLLTGDARGDDTLAAVALAKLLKGGTMHVDVLKVPHHGSDRNVETEFFRKITADHYVISGDGEHGNPEVPTLGMISEAREGDDDFTLHLTYQTGKKDLGSKLKRFFDKDRKAGRKYKVAFRGDDDLSIRVDLLGKVTH